MRGLSKALLSLSGLGLLCAGGPVAAARFPDKGKARASVAKPPPSAATQPKRSNAVTAPVARGGGTASGRWPQIAADLMP